MIHGFKNPGVEMGVVAFIITPSDPNEIFTSFPATLCSAGLEILVPEGGMLQPRNATMITLNTAAWLL